MKRGNAAQAVNVLLDEANRQQITPANMRKACKALRSLGIVRDEARDILARLELCDASGNPYTSDEGIANDMRALILNKG